MTTSVSLPVDGVSLVIKWFVKKGSTVRQGSVLCSYKKVNESTIHKLKNVDVGTVSEICTEPNSLIKPG